MKKNEFSKQVLQVFFDALDERTRQIGDLVRTGLTRNIRSAASVDFAATNKACGIVERILINISEGESSAPAELYEETLNVLFEALRERAAKTNEVYMKGLTPAIRNAAKVDMDETYMAWRAVEIALAK